MKPDHLTHAQNAQREQFIADQQAKIKLAPMTGDRVEARKDHAAHWETGKVIGQSFGVPFYDVRLDTGELIQSTDQVRLPQ